MGAIKTTSLVEGNLAAEPKHFPQGQYPALVSFRILHTERRLNPQTDQWEDGRTTAVDVNFHGDAAERYARIIRKQPGQPPAVQSYAKWAASTRYASSIGWTGTSMAARTPAFRTVDKLFKCCPILPCNTYRGCAGR